MSGLDFKNATPGTTPEDFIFSRIDFSRYREIHEKDFNYLFLDGIEDFDEVFFKENFKLDIEEIKPIIENCYEKVDGIFILRRENPLILSIMRTLETSLEDKPLFSPEETGEELYDLLLTSLNGVTVIHKDGMETRLFASEEGLSGTFQPGGKPWTRVLILT